jgi:hypothetical protein
VKAALANVSSDAAFRRPAPERHNIAEIALHRAYCARGVRAKLAGVDADPFVLDGDDWFALSDPSTLAWSTILEIVQLEQERLAACVADIASGIPIVRLVRTGGWVMSIAPSVSFLQHR